MDFENELRRLKDSLNETEKQISLRVDIATIYNLSNVISKQPTILHFICHGDYSEER